MSWPRRARFKDSSKEKCWRAAWYWAATRRSTSPTCSVRWTSRDAGSHSASGATTDERAEPANADEIDEGEGEGQGQARPEQEAADPSRKAPARGARARDQGTGSLRRVVQFEPAGVRWRPLELFVPHGRPGHR